MDLKNKWFNHSAGEFFSPVAVKILDAADILSSENICLTQEKKRRIRKAREREGENMF